MFNNLKKWEIIYLFIAALILSFYIGLRLGTRTTEDMIKGVCDQHPQGAFFKSKYGFSFSCLTSDNYSAGTLDGNTLKGL